MKGLQRRCHFRFSQVGQQSVDQGGFFGIGLAVQLVVGTEHGVDRTGCRLEGRIGADQIGAVHREYELDRLVAFTVFGYQLVSCRAFGDAVDAFAFTVDTFLVTGSQRLEMQRGNRNGQDTVVYLRIHVLVGRVAQLRFVNRADLFC